MNIILWRWFANARSLGYPISGPILQEEALKIAKKIGIEDGSFMASEGWLHKLKSRNDIISLKICGESGAADIKTAIEWKSNLMLFYEDYDFADIFNMDESGYMFRFLPDTILSRSRDICKGGKHAKDRLTIVLTCSTLGEKLPPIINREI
mgnify:CR=1 FL=1